MPKIKLIKPEGTYILWVNFSGLGLSDDEISSLLINKAKLWFNPGTKYGPTGYGFQRINIALPRHQLQYAMEQLEKTFKDY